MGLIKKSEGFTQEYSCNIIRVGEVVPIEGSDFLAKTLVNFEPIVVRKDQVKEGDVLFYVDNESQICSSFLSVNNLFEWGSRDLNSNYQEVEDVAKEDLNKAKRMVGFFAKTGRVRAIRLKGQPSMGYLFGINEMIKYNSKFEDFDMESHIGEMFDMVEDEIFVKAYVPLNSKKENNHVGTGEGKLNKRLKKLDRMIEGEFSFHYDTNPLKKNIRKINPTDKVTISCKIHGTSLIIGNVKVKNFIKLPIHKRFWNWLCDKFNANEDKMIPNYYVDYGNVYSSRKVIKNKNYNPNVTDGFYGSNDIWEDCNKILSPYIPNGMTVYAEVVGYVTNSSKMIQKNYDYGCLPGENKIMPYRITSETIDGDKYEWEVTEVKEWTEKVIYDHPEIKDKIMMIPILYYGTLANLYPDIPNDEVWHERVLTALEEDKEHFKMEEKEPLCKYHQVPREGIVIRINHDPITEAFKLKTEAFLSAERKAIDNGEVDIEMEENSEES